MSSSGARRRGGMAARGARAAGRAHAAHRRAHDRGCGRSGRQYPHRPAFLQGLQQLGWSVGRQRADRLPLGCGRYRPIRRYAAELVALAPDVILATAARPRAVAAGDPHRAHRVRDVPDPVGSGFVDSLARPGGNATGFSCSNTVSAEMAGAAQGDRAARDAGGGHSGPAITSGIGQLAAIQSVAPSLGMEVIPVNVRDAGEIERAVAAFAHSVEWRPDCDSERVGGGSSRSDHHAGGPAQTTRGLLRSHLRCRAAA